MDAVDLEVQRNRTPFSGRADDDAELATQRPDNDRELLLPPSRTFAVVRPAEAKKVFMA